MEAVIAQLKQEFSEKIDKVNLEDIDTVEAFLFIHLEILSQHEALYRNFISQRRLLGEQVNVCYLGIQSIFFTSLWFTFEGRYKGSIKYAI
ncbi:hypothetical protein [Enterococcus rivorum]|uniref:hypothetical protein n=1 Tax=Enterococcus rivorum TaxID=762845 RepID=UPI003644DE58